MSQIQTLRVVPNAINSDVQIITVTLGTFRKSNAIKGLVVFKILDVSAFELAWF